MEILKCRRHVKYEAWLKAPITWEWVFLLTESGPRKLIWRKLCQRLLPFLGQKWFEGVNSRIVPLLAANGLWNFIWRKLCQRLLPFFGAKWFQGVNSRIVSLLAASGLWNLIWTNLKLSRKNVVPDSLLSDCKTNSQRQINKILQMGYHQQLQFDLKLIHFSSFTKRKTAC